MLGDGVIPLLCSCGAKNRPYHKSSVELFEIVNAIVFNRVHERQLDLLKKSAIMSTHVINITHKQHTNNLDTARMVKSQ